ncbi:disintegrin and metallo ase domain-containing 15 isoform X2 [Pelobates cultripes]|uniref:Disintegrin and metallo ase domain-containing 15 isoform X2 n=1 Tax=Pelobates cultripes TaxID=61616 RepID=A0AAD1TN17_PELCU|nr:disintegrin and metallo ase domain-containing 15 isoform X2 [Pelobates cultripes]
MTDKACGLLILLCGLSTAGGTQSKDTERHPHTETWASPDLDSVGHTAWEPDWRKTADKELLDQVPYWDVFPELRVQGRRLNLEEANQSLPSQLHLLLHVEGSNIELELEQNRHLMPASHKLAYYLPDGTRVVEKNPQLVNCFYHGHVLGHTKHWSSLSLCSGFRGTIILAPDRSYSIEPVLGDLSNKHVLRLIQDHQHQNLTCASGNVKEEILSSPPHRMRRDVVSEIKYVELVMVADYSEYKLFYKDLKSLQIRMLEIVNKVDAFYRTLNIRVVLVSVEVWNMEDQITVSTDPTLTLNRFLAWREKRLLKLVPHDNAQLLTGITFKDSLVGMATMSSLCTTDKSGGVNMDHSVSVLGVASTVAHNLGHNLGLNHDTLDRKCGDPENGKQWIMEPSYGFMPGLEFSKCSLTDLVTSLRKGRFLCLFNTPSPWSLFGGARCGNMLVEEKEQCDCGLTQECTDPCCNPSTCQFIEGAQCSSDGMCCEQCKLKPSGSLCRDRLGECDLPEYCNGILGQCPPNVFVQNGESCEEGQAYCFDGECQTLQTQCQNLWGPGSLPAPESCFRKMNMRGDKYGNCGQGENGSYIPCSEEDVQCGKIQCQVGSNQTVLESITVRVTVNRTELTCNGTSFNRGDDVLDLALVMTGTVCGAGKVCIKQKCQEVSYMKVQSCKNQCSNHGICDSNNTCHCDPGWAMPDCGTWAERHVGSSLTTSLCLIFLVFIPILVLFGFCLLKREFLKRKLGMLSSSSKCQYRVTQTNSQPRPQRPPPPNWAQNTELQVMSANTQDSDRPDPPSKPLPPDPVQKRCQAPDQDRPPPPTRPLPADPLPRQAQVTRPQVVGTLQWWLITKCLALYAWLVVGAVHAQSEQI